MDQEIQKKLDEQAASIEAVYRSVEKIRKYLLITAWVTIIVVVVPLIGLVFVIPVFLHNYVDTIGNLGF